MDTTMLLSAIDDEISRLTQARELLAGGQNKVSHSPKRRNLSADARKRIADAQRRRWAAQKKNA
jgi:hypothetical protein